MTIKSWRKEFMPKMPTKRLTKRQAIEHSLRKWEGLTEKNIEAHGLTTHIRWICGIDDDLEIGAESCALCVKYFKDKPEENLDECELCPLYETLGKSCDSFDEPYSVWYTRKDPLPMIKALKKTLKRLDKEQGKS